LWLFQGEKQKDTPIENNERNKEAIEGAREILNTRENYTLKES
jgi:hypothetical protein